jgi:hypothetical protein
LQRSVTSSGNVKNINHSIPPFKINFVGRASSSNFYNVLPVKKMDLNIEELDKENNYMVFILILAVSYIIPTIAIILMLKDIIKNIIYIKKQNILPKTSDKTENNLSGR